MRQRQLLEIIKLTVLLSALATLAGYKLARSAHGQTLPGMNSADIGQPTPAGTTSGAVTVSAAGANVWDRTDSFRFVYQKVSGDFTAEVRVDDVNQPSGVECLVGLMARGSLEPNAANVYARSTGNAGTPFKLGVRAAPGAATTSSGNIGANTPGYSIRLVRKGSEFAGQWSRDGSTWITIAAAQIALPAECYVGPAVCSRAPGKLATVEFTGFTVSQTAPATQSAATQPTPPLPPPQPPIASLPNKQPIISAGAPVLLSPQVDLDRRTWENGTKIVLPVGTLTIDQTIRIAGSARNIWVCGVKNPDGTPATWIDRKLLIEPSTGRPKSWSSLAIEDGAQFIRFENVGFSGEGGAKITIQGKDVTFINCPVKGSGDGYMLRGAEYTVIADVHVGVLNSYLIFADWEREADGPNKGHATEASVARNRNSHNAIIRCSSQGATNSADVRLYAFDDGLIQDCDFRNGDWKALQFRDGKRTKVVNTKLDGAIPVTIGPRADVEEACGWVDDLSFLQCSSTGQWELESGVRNLLLDRCSITSSKNSCLTVRVNFMSKGVASGAITNSTFAFTGPRPYFFFANWTGGIATKDRGNSFNGVPVK